MLDMLVPVLCTIMSCSVYNRGAYKGDGASAFMMTFLCHTKREERMFGSCAVCYHRAICGCLQHAIYDPGEGQQRAECI